MLWYDFLGENHNPLQRNGMAAIPKIYITSSNDYCDMTCLFYRQRKLFVSFLPAQISKSLNNSFSYLDILLQLKERTDVVE